MTNDKLFVKQYIQRISDEYMQTWHSNCLENKKLVSYVQYKTFLKPELYILQINVKKFRQCLAAFRSSSHPLMIEMGRHLGIPRDYRVCLYCEGVVEDEFHFVMSCPLYQDIRVNYLQTHYIDHASVHSFNALMASEDVNILQNLAMFLFYALKKRDSFLTIFN